MEPHYALLKELFTQVYFNINSVFAAYDVLSCPRSENPMRAAFSSSLNMFALKRTV